MRITISGRNIELTDGLKAAVEDKIGKLEKYFTPDTDVFVTLSVEKERQKIEVTIPVPGHIIRSEQVSNDMLLKNILRLLHGFVAINIFRNNFPCCRDFPMSCLKAAGLFVRS